MTNCYVCGAETNNDCLICEYCDEINSIELELEINEDIPTYENNS